MMRRNLFHIIYLIVGLSILPSCVEREKPIKGGDGYTVLRWGSGANVSITTKSTLDHYSENRVQNLYIFVFNAAGQKIYGKWFDNLNSVSQSVFDSSPYDEYWYVNNSSNPSTTSSGACRIKVSAGSNYKIYALTNLDADMINVSSDRLSHEIYSIDDLKDFQATLNQNVLERNGYFPMTGFLDNVSVAGDGEISVAGGSANLLLNRIDAKVKFVFITGNEPDERGQVIKAFHAEQWRVVNVPKKTYVLSYGERGLDELSGKATGGDAGSVADDFFTSHYVNFEEYPSTTQSEFSFYMMENRMTPKKGCVKFTDRDRQIKLPSGLNGEFEYANDYSTYVEVTGSVEMDLDENDSAGKTLGGHVKYLIHLGDFGGDVADFNTLRNHFYTYRVTVNSVNNIRVEVETGTVENQPGATGSITIAKEEIAICDAHYMTKTLVFHAANLSDDLTWYVKTPFAEGQPILEGGIPIVAGLDYKWIHFRVNRRGADGLYSEARQVYDPTPYSETNPGGLMDINQLVEYMKRQKRLYSHSPEASDFERPNDGPNVSRIVITAFVDEYYYDSNPLTGETRFDLWKDFVNQEDRYMHILCDSNMSNDKESRAIGSVITIQQRSIQTIYNTDPTHNPLRTAWGTERVDEYADLWRYNVDGSRTGSGQNSHPFNGLSNSLYEWGLYNSLDGTVDWSLYLNVEVDNDTPLLQTPYQSLRYSCLTRNRDNNGNGKIDRDEIVWYLASHKQLVGLFMGDDILDKNSKLYNRSEAQRLSSDPRQWRQHTISSTKYNTSSEPMVLWGEEGIASSNISGSISWGFDGDPNKAIYTIRCVRNLGMDRGHDVTMFPQDYVEMTGTPEDGYNFITTHLNNSVLRYYTSRELDFDDEHSTQNKLYKQFHVAPVSIAKTFGAINFRNFHQNINERNSVDAGYCPEGYRIPNQREMAVMLAYIKGVLDGNGELFTRTYFSMGGYNDETLPYANIHGGAEPRKMGFGYNTNLFLVENNNVTTARCVKDVRVD